MLCLACRSSWNCRNLRSGNSSKSSCELIVVHMQINEALTALFFALNCRLCQMMWPSIGHTLYLMRTEAKSSSCKSYISDGYLLYDYVCIWGRALKLCMSLRFILWFYYHFSSDHHKKLLFPRFIPCKILSSSHWDLISFGKLCLFFSAAFLCNQRI